MKIDISDILVSDGADMKVDLTGVPLQTDISSKVTCLSAPL